jgi:hypothetical protein
MRTKLANASQRAGMHPLNFLLATYTMVGGLEDAWPEIDDGYVETVLALRHSHAFIGSQDATLPATKGATSARVVETELPVSESAARVLDKLERGDRWGRNAISFDTLRNHVCRGIPSIDSAVDELVTEDLLVPGGGRRGPYSLNPDRKAEIERIVSQLRAQKER